MSHETIAVKPLLKWPGGKRWLAPLLVPLLRDELRGTYFEPFLGGAAVFLSLAPARAELSDINGELVQFLRTMKASPAAVINLAASRSNTRRNYYRIRDSRPTDRIERAARFLFLNRTAWGGIYRLNRAGEFNVPFGNSKRPVIPAEGVGDAVRVFRRAALKESDFEEQIARAISGDVVYADPPYTTRGQFNGFVRYNEEIFSWSDQVRLSEASRSAKRRGVFVAVSGVFHRDMARLYENWWVLIHDRHSLIARDVASRRQVAEAVYLSRKPQSRTLLGCREIKRVTPEFIQSIPHHQ